MVVRFQSHLVYEYMKSWPHGDPTSDALSGLSFWRIPWNTKLKVDEVVKVDIVFWNDAAYDAFNHVANS